MVATETEACTVSKRVVRILLECFLVRLTESVEYSNAAHTTVKLHSHKVHKTFP